MALPQISSEVVLQIPGVPNLKEFMGRRIPSYVLIHVGFGECGSLHSASCRLSSAVLHMHTSTT
jgi:hypothetical protein